MCKKHPAALTVLLSLPVGISPRERYYSSVYARVNTHPVGSCQLCAFCQVPCSLRESLITAACVMGMALYSLYGVPGTGEMLMYAKKKETFTANLLPPLSSGSAEPPVRLHEGRAEQQNLCDWYHHWDPHWCHVHHILRPFPHVWVQRKVRAAHHAVGCASCSIRAAQPWECRTGDVGTVFPAFPPGTQTLM